MAMLNNQMVFYIYIFRILHEITKKQPAVHPVPRVLNLQNHTIAIG